MPSSPFITIGKECPGQMITGFTPSSGPPGGRTVITIKGTNLGVTFDDFLVVSSNITVGGVICTPLHKSYLSGKRVLCQTGPGMKEGEQDLMVNLVRNSGIALATLGGFMVVLPTVSSVEPEFGPIAGGSRLIIRGTGLDIGNTARIILDAAGLECRDM